MKSSLSAPPQIQASARFRKVAECLYRHESSGTYYALVKRSGKQFRRSLKTTDRKLAGRRLSELREKVGRVKEIKGVARATFAELADRWYAMTRATLKESSATRRLDHIKHLKSHFGQTPVRSITARACEDWVIIGSGGVAASTYNQRRETLRAILELARRDGLLLDNPATFLPRKKMARGKTSIPTHEQFRLLVSTIRALDSRAQVGASLVELLAYSGMRLSEATALEWEDVDFARGSFTVTGGQKGTKNHEVRTVPLFPALRELLESLEEGRDSQAANRVISIYDAKKAIDSACRNAGLPHFSHHTMRHYFVSNAIERGIDFKTIAAWVGHKDGGILVAKTYGHLRDIHSFEMAKLMTISATSRAIQPDNVIKLPVMG